MKGRSRKIFWGILIASVRVYAFGMLLFPSCFGFALLYLGLHDLEKNSGGVWKKKTAKLNAAAAALVLVSAMSDFLAVVPFSSVNGIWRMAPAILEYIVFYFLLDLYTALRPVTAGLRRAYALVMGAAVCGYGISLIFASGGWQVFCFIVMLVCRFLALKAAYCDRMEVDNVGAAP